MKKPNFGRHYTTGNMCEWLCGGGGGEWCDVRLVCGGGRALPAHRSVLASVSPFLKNLLLSCPKEDFPVFIVLPDFDLDALSSVLYYIYNGEVTVEKHKLEMFLDIVKSMQIYIDYQYLPQAYNENTNNFDKQSNLLDRENIFTGESDNIHDEKFIKIKKGQPIGELLTSPLNFCNLRESQPRGNDSEVNAMSFTNLQFEGRQRNSFLRDLFIETYPRNGKVNGLTPSVLAITNERYHGPTSVLLTNANDKHLSDPHPPSKISNHTPDLATCLSMEMQRYEVHCPRNYDQINERSMNYPLQMRHNLTPHIESITDFKLRNITSDFDDKYQVACPSVEKNMSTKKIARMVKEGYRKNSSIKVPILNHVLESPWCPRQPNNFKPSHKKCDDTTRKSIEGTGVKEHDKTNDGNNNIRASEILLEKNDIQLSTIIEEPADHKATNNSIERFQCTTCNQVFSSAESLASHTKRHSSGGRHNCDECGKSFSQLRNYKYHMSVHRGTREFAATCSVCGKYFNDRGYLSSHMKIHRNRKEYKCSMCPKSFNQRVAYNMHVRIHTGIKPHVCDQCGKAFSRKMLLKQHQRTHSGERPYACPHCDKRFADRSNMTLHLRLHTGVKPFTCMLCPKSFTKKHHLKSHVNFHTGAKPYSCPRCQLGFTQSSNMRTHLKKCSAPQPPST